MMYWVLAACTIIGGIAGVWFFWDKIAAQCMHKPESLPEMQVSRQTADEMGLETYLKKLGYRLFWGDFREREYYLSFGDYELIKWTDTNGKVWLLVPCPDGSIPLQTKYPSEEIEKRKQARKQIANK